MTDSLLELPECIMGMLRKHGLAYRNCKSCKHLLRMGGHKACRHNTSADWRANWPACGLFDAKRR